MVFGDLDKQEERLLFFAFDTMDLLVLERNAKLQFMPLNSTYLH